MCNTSHFFVLSVFFYFKIQLLFLGCCVCNIVSQCDSAAHTPYGGHISALTVVRGVTSILAKYDFWI